MTSGLFLIVNLFLNEVARESRLIFLFEIVMGPSYRRFVRMLNVFKQKPRKPLSEIDALAELLMLSVIILLVSELPDCLITNTIIPTLEFYLRKEKPKKPFLINTLKNVHLNIIIFL